MQIGERTGRRAGRRPGVRAREPALPPGRTCTSSRRSARSWPREAASRPTGTPRAEDVLAALAAAGIKVPATKQFLGATVGATYCFGGRAESGLGVSVCEYSDEDAAQKGRELSLTKFKDLPNRTILVNKKTTLTLAAIAAPPAAGDPEVSKASDVFSKL